MTFFLFLCWEKIFIMKPLLFVFGLLSISSAEKSQVLREFSTSYDAFTANVYKRISESSSRNFVICPLSADLVLAHAASGAQNQTARELITALQLPEEPLKFQELFTTLSQNLQDGDKYNLKIANRMYVKNGFHINSQFKKVTRNVFNVDIQNIDFEKKIDAANEINKWVENKTQSKIMNLIDPNLLNKDTRTLLINAIYYHGKWVKQFDASSNKLRPFYLNKNHSTSTKMMSADDYYEYYESSELNAKFLKLDYAGNEVSMHVVLPNDIEGLSLLEEKLSDVLVPPKYTKENVHVLIPKMKLETQIKFKPILQSMGVKSAFEDDANFRGIATGKENLKITEVIQKAFLDVTEEGTTAAASTGLFQYVLLSGVVPETQTKTFFANRPFLFYMRLNKLGINFFVGRHVHPSL